MANRVPAREYPSQYLGSRRTTAGASSMAGGGASVLSVPRHALDGTEHTEPADSTRLDASITAHGLMPKLDGDAADVFHGDGSQGPVAATQVTFDDGVAGIGAIEVQSGIEILAASIASITAGVGLPWFVVTDPTYGAVGDNSADDTTPVNATIAAYNAAGGGVLYFPRSGYKITAGLTALTAPGLVLGDGMGATHASQIRETSSTADLFTINSDGVSFRGLDLNCSATTPTAGSAIKVNAGIQARYENLSVGGFYTGLDLATGNVWAITGCDLQYFVKYALRVRNSTSADAGDWMISDTVFSQFGRNADAAIRLESGGGGKIINVKFNGDSGSGRYARMIDIAPAGTTTILLVANCSLENYTGDGVHYATTGASWNHISIIGCQFGQYGNTTGSAVNMDGASDVLITHLVLRVTGGGSPVAVKLTNVNRAVVGPFTNDGFATLLQTTSCTSIDDRTTSGASGVTVQDEGSPLATAGTTLNFVGLGVVASGTGATKTITISGSSVAALDDLTDVTITSPTSGDRTRYNGSAWVNSALIWAPVMVLDPGTGNYNVLTDTSGNPIMAEV